MGKGKGKGSTGAASAIPDGGVSLDNSNSASANSIPQLEEGAFAGLRQKIEQKLKDQNAAKEQKEKNKAKGGAKDTPKNEKKDTASKSGPAQGSSNNDKKDNKGKKRDRNGDLIGKDAKPDTKEKPSKSEGDEDENDALRREILALGGTEEDLDLVADVGTDSEAEDSAEAKKKPSDKSQDDALRKELASMLAAAGQVVPDDIEEEDEEQEQEEEAEVDGDDESDEQEEEEASEEEEEEEEGESSPEPPSAPKEKAEKAEKAKEAPKAEEFVVPKQYQKLAVPPRSDWYMTPLPSIPTRKQVDNLPRVLIDRVHEHAKSLLEKDTTMYNEAQQSSASSSHRFYSTIMSSGTLSDKISALTLAVQESPVHNTKALETLVGLGKKRSRTQAVEVLRSLKDMFAQGTLLPSDRRLRAFANQPLLEAAFNTVGNRWSERDPLPGGLQNSHLVLWAFEDFVKEQYFEVLKILEVWCSDEIEFSRSRALTYVFELLKEKPEQEANLLRLLVNKLGDPSKKISSRASYLLLQLQQAHPLMKKTVIKAVEEVLFRPGQAQHAKYYGIITLNQTVLSSKEEDVAGHLLDIYFSLFVALLKPTKHGKGKPGKKHGETGPKKNNKKAKEEAEKGLAQEQEMQEKLVSAVLTGVNRAYPFTSSDTERLSKHIDTLFRITHSANFNTSIQALMLIQQLTSSHQVGSDRFYRTLYESLLDPRVATSSKQSLYLNLLFKALKNDVNVRRVKAFVKRLVQILGMHQPAFICGIFYLIRELEKTYAGLQTLLDQPEENDSDDEEVFRDVPDEDDEPVQEPVEESAKPQKPSNGYDPRKRDPEHSNAEKTCLWELLPYLTHFHPSVSVNASNLLDHETMSGKPDLTLHTLSHFLDRFIYRTPKASQGARGASIMQPLAGGDTSDRLVIAGQAAAHAPLNSEAFWKKRADEVAAEDVFFHEYFSRVGKDKEKARVKKEGKDRVSRGDGEDGSDDESEIWKALVDSRPELEGAGDSDDDLDMDDLESAYDADEKDEDEDGQEGSDGEGVIFNDESDPEDIELEDNMSEDEAPAAKPKSQTKAKGKPSDEDDDEDDNFDMDVSDEDAFVGSDEELPFGFDDLSDDGEEQEQEQVQSKGKGKGKDQGKKDDEEGSKKKRKLKHLPTFASADDYAELLAGEDEGM